MKEYIFPKRIKEEKNVKQSENLTLKKDLQIGLSETSLTTFSDDSYIVLDFGAELRGGIRILTFFAKNTPVRIRFGESLTECCAELGGKQNATNDHSLRDFTVNLQDYSDMTFGGTGFRFVRLDFFGEAQIKRVVAENSILHTLSCFFFM